MKRHTAPNRAQLHFCTLTLLLLLLFLPKAQAGVVAYWQFEPGNPGADSSGNGNDLFLNGVTASADIAPNAPGTGSAIFDGTTSWAQTFNALDLSGATNLTIEWFMKTTQTATAIVLEHGSGSASAGSVGADINDAQYGVVRAGEHGSSGWWLKDTFYTAGGVWQHYAMTIDSSYVNTNRISLYVGGVLVTNITFTEADGTPAPFRWDWFNIGARNGGTSYHFQGQLDEIRISDEVLTPDQFLIHVDYTNASVIFLQQPANTTVRQLLNATFHVSALVSNAPPTTLDLQWQRFDSGGSTWTNIPGAKDTSYTLPSVDLPDNGAQFRVVARVIAGHSTNITQTATLTVSTDTVPPHLVSAGSLDGNSIGIAFDKSLDAVSAANAANYTISGNSVTSATVMADGKSVLLTLASQLSGSSFTVAVNNVADVLGNVIAPNSVVSGTIMGISILDINNSAASGADPSYVFSSRSNECDVVAGAGEVGGSGADSCIFLYRAYTGDFDVCVQVPSFICSAFYSRGSLDVRESLDPGSREDLVFVYPTRGVFIPYYRNVTGGGWAGGPGGTVNWGSTVSYPNVWMRWTRAGDVMASYWSANGLDWNSIAQFTPSPVFPSTVYVGLTTTAENSAPGGAAKATYLNFGNTPPSPVRIITQPVSGTLMRGGNYTFTVGLGGLQPFAIQWMKGGVPIAGATNSSLTLTSVAFTDAGTYSVTASNYAGTVTSSNATLTVIVPTFSDNRISLAGVQVFDAQTFALNNRGDQANAIDGNLGTFSLLAPDGTTTPQIVAFDLAGGLQAVNRLRVAKAGDIDGSGTTGHMDLTILYTTNTGPLNARTYYPVSGLSSGFNGSEPITAAAVNPIGTVVQDSHDYATSGFYSLTFSDVKATAIAIKFARDPMDSATTTTYKTFEAQVYEELPVADVSQNRNSIQTFSAGRMDRTRNEVINAIDGNSLTASYLTKSYTVWPVIAAFDLGSATTVSKIRVDKDADTDGNGIVDHMDLQVLYTTDTGPLMSRQYFPVSNLTNGDNGYELITADSVNATNATVINDVHQGYYSLTFEAVNATAVALRIAKNPVDTLPNVHYHTREFEAYAPDMTYLTRQSVKVFTLGHDLTTRGDANNAIDQGSGGIGGNLNTATYLNSSDSGTTGGPSGLAPQIAAIDFGIPIPVDHLRVAKRANIDGVGSAAEHMDLQILYTTDTGPLNTRNYAPVTGLANGYLGTELITAAAVNSNGTVTQDIHDYATSGYYSLTFDRVNATALAIQYSRDALDSPNMGTYYYVWDIQAHNSLLTFVPSSLAISRSGSNINLAWNDPLALGYVLQSSASVSGGTWTTVTNAPTVNGSSYAVTVQPAANALYFRLKK
jgi:hypothetical protein